MRDTTTLTDMIRQAFQYWDEVPPLYPVRSTDELQRNYENQSGPTHWFDPDTLRFFGSRNRHLVRPGLMVETQTKAPEGVGRYAVTAWVIDVSAHRDHRTIGRIVPQKIGTFHSLTEARRFAVEVSDVWVEAMKNTEVAR
jgi:hypothetical protein